MTVHWTVIYSRLTLRSAAGELSGGYASALRVNSVLLHYLPLTGSKCLVRNVASEKGTSANVTDHAVRLFRFHLCDGRDLLLIEVTYDGDGLFQLVSKLGGKQDLCICEFTKLPKRFSFH